MASGLIAELLRARAAEKQQALFYRALASTAENAADSATAERLNDLHADEQHHFSRISVRLMELGENPPNETTRAPNNAAADLTAWEMEARRREQSEIDRYEQMLKLAVDDETKKLLEGILEVERHHAESLGGKWTPASGNREPGTDRAASKPAGELN